MTKEEALLLARAMFPTAVLAEPQADGDMMHGYRVYDREIRPWSHPLGEGKCWEVALVRAGVPVATVVARMAVAFAAAPTDPEDRRPGRVKTPEGKARDLLAAMMGVTPQALLRRQQRARPASP